MKKTIIQNQTMTINLFMTQIEYEKYCKKTTSSKGWILYQIIRNHKTLMRQLYLRLYMSFE